MPAAGQLVGFALARAEQPPLDHLNGVGLQVGEQEEQPIFRRCQRAGPVDGEAVRGFPSRRHAAIWSWNAASKGATRTSNSSKVKLVRLRNSAGRACTSANRTPVMDRASCQGTVLSQIQHFANRDKLRSISGPVRSKQGRKAQSGTVKLLGGSRELSELDGERAGGGYAAGLMPQTSCHASKARARSAR